MGDRLGTCATCGSLAFFHEAEGEGQTSYVAPIYTPERAEAIDNLIATASALARELPHLTDKLPEPAWARIAELTDAMESAIAEAAETGEPE